ATPPIRSHPSRESAMPIGEASPGSSMKSRALGATYDASWARRLSSTQEATRGSAPPDGSSAPGSGARDGSAVGGTASGGPGSSPRSGSSDLVPGSSGAEGAPGTG